MKMNYECINLNPKMIPCSSNVMYGFNRPLNEQCPLITGQIRNGPEEGCSSLWNNLTRRKTLVIKDKRNNNII